MNEQCVPLISLQELPDPGSRGFSLPLQGETLEGFLVKKEGKVFAYRNRCPHLGAPLDWSPHQFLDPQSDFIQCAMHGALFQIETGLCVSGPCVNQRLEPLALTLRDDRVLLALKPV
jgi:nitrite reductase/ring-hydroxylating ferredoxin subunit